MFILTWHDDIKHPQHLFTQFSLPLQQLLWKIVSFISLHPPVHLGQVILDSDQGDVVGVENLFVFLEECFMSLHTTLLRMIFVEL